MLGEIALRVVQTVLCLGRNHAAYGIARHAAGCAQSAQTI